MQAEMPEREPGAAPAGSLRLPVGMTSESNERPWPVPPHASEEPIPPVQERAGSPGRTAFRVILLLGLLGVVTAAGVVVGRSVEPGVAPPPVTSVSTTAPAPKRQPPPRRKVVPPVTLRWGPLRAVGVGHLPPGAGDAGAVLAGQTLVVVGGTGSARILVGPADGQLAVAGALAAPVAGMAVFRTGAKLWGVGGVTGGKVSDAVLRLDVTAGRARAAGTFEEPLADAGVVPAAGSVYLVGGWTGTAYASAVLQFTPPSTVRLVARLPQGLRSPAVALVGHTIYVAGGRGDLGQSTAVYAVDVDAATVATLGQLPQPVEGGVLLAIRGKLFLVGGTTTRERASGAVIAIDPQTAAVRLVGRLTKPLVGAAAVPAGARPLVVDAPSGTVYRVG